MKSILCTYGIAFLCVLSAYGQEDRRKLVVTTTTVFADMAEVIAGELVEVKSIVPVHSDPHHYKPAPGDTQLISRADLVLQNGFSLDDWLNKLIKEPHIQKQILTEGIFPIAGSQHQRLADPHAWMDASNGLIYIRNIKDALIRLDPENADIYEFNYGIYRQQLEAMDDYIRAAILSIPEPQRILITSCDAFSYYGSHYGIEVQSLAGSSPQADAPADLIIPLRELAKERGVPVVFLSTSADLRLWRPVASGHGIEIGGQLYADALGDENSPASTYLDMLQYNTDAIVKALSKELPTLPERVKGVNAIWPYLLLAALLSGGLLLVQCRRKR